MTGTISETRQEILKVLWEIDGFLSLPGSVGSSIKSPAFRFSDSSYHLAVFPYGDKNANSSIGLYLHPDQSPSSSAVIFTLAVEKADGTFLKMNPSCYKFHNQGGYGYTGMVKRSDIVEKKDEFLSRGALIFSCILRKVSPVEAIDVVSVNLNKLLVSSAHSDVTVKLQSREYQAHRAVLAAQSEVFASALEHDTLERESGVIQIKDCDSDSFQEFLHYLYTGCANINESNVYHLFKTADKYLVEELKVICVAYLMENISVDNVCDAVALAHDHGMIDLKSQCKEFFSDNVISITATSEWISLMKGHSVAANELLRHFAKAKN